MEEKDFQTLATELKAKIDAKELSANEEIKAIKALYDAQQAELKELTIKNNKLNVLTEKSNTFSDVVSETLNMGGLGFRISISVSYTATSLPLRAVTRTVALPVAPFTFNGKETSLSPVSENVICCIVLSVEVSKPVTSN